MTDLNKLRQVKEYKINQDNERIALGNVKPTECPLDPIEEAKILIVDKITKHFSDFLFEMVNNEMGKNHVFQSQSYLTEEGYEQFEDEWLNSITIITVILFMK